MMSEMVRRPSEQCSPKTSPRGNRSPVVVPRQDSTGTLKTTISLGKTPAIVHSGPFYLMKELPPPSELTGATNLIQYHNLEHSFNRFCGRKIKDQLSSFLPNLPGNIDAVQEDSSLRKLIERPPITSIELSLFTKQQLDSAFRLHVGPVPEQYRFMSQTVQRKRHKHKKSKTKGTGGESPPNDTHVDSVSDIMLSNREHEKKHKKQKRHDEEKEQRRKKKKDKKKKKRHSPDSPPYDSQPMAMDDASPMMAGGNGTSMIQGPGPGTPSSGGNSLNNNGGHHSSPVAGGSMSTATSLLSNGVGGSLSSANRPQML